MRNVVVVGSNRGIGLEIARVYAQRGDHVIGACRKSSQELADTGAVVVEGIDVAEADCGEKIALRLIDLGIDVLVVVAGIMHRTALEQVVTSSESMRREFEVNALGPLRVVAGVRGVLKNPSKVALLTSRMGSIDDNTSGGYYGYRMSKAALNMAARSLAIDLKGSGVAVDVIHPGFVRTDMTGGRGDIDAADAAKNIVARVDEMSLATSGRFRHANGTSLPW
jgi:NAD(P)-dependent dehydrogenase (short-subunit alcohol dehydrogenase family)